MPEAAIANLSAQPCFDLESFMNFARETRLSGEEFELLARLWEEWLAIAQAARISEGKDSWLAVWLPEEVERAIDETWRESPGKGLLLNSLAQYLCMAIVADLVPQIENMGCAPTPAPVEPLNQALLAIGAAMPGAPGQRTLRRFAVLTHYPFKGGCEICAFRESCPKNGAQAEMPGFTLPGHERGEPA